MTDRTTDKLMAALSYSNEQWRRREAERREARTFTHPSVIEGIRAGASWADPTMDPTTIDWDERQARAAIPFEVVNGRPVNPREKTGIRYGRNAMGHWGEALAADALVLASTPAGERYVLMVERDDAARAEWVRADSYAALTHHLAGEFGGVVFPAHVDMLHDALA